MKCLINGGWHCIRCHVKFGRGGLRTFQTFTDISLPEKLIWKSRRSQNKTFIRGASPGIPYELWDKHAIGWRRWNIAINLTIYPKLREVSIENLQRARHVIRGSLLLWTFGSVLIRDLHAESCSNFETNLSWTWMSCFPTFEFRTSFPVLYI